jgi:hypothetical protein
MHLPIDECAKCTVRGDMDGCLATRCNLHESWYARSQHARITELEAQLAQRFDAADMATAAAQGFRDGVASLSANAGEPRNAIDRDALIDAIAQGLHGTWHCTRVWEAWHVGTMSQYDFEPVDESETPTEIADAVLALLAAPPTAQAEGVIAEQALRKVLAAVQRYMPPDGPDAKDTLSEIIAIVDPWPLGPLEKS